MSSINFNTQQTTYDSFNDSGVDNTPLSPTSAICAKLENPEIFNSLMSNPAALRELFQQHKEMLISTFSQEQEEKVEAAYQKGLKKGNEEIEEIYTYIEMQMVPQVRKESIETGRKAGFEQCQKEHQQALNSLEEAHAQELARTAAESQLKGQNICTSTHRALIEAAVNERVSPRKASMSKIESEHAEHNQLWYNHGFQEGQNACSASHASMIEQARLEQEQNRPKYVNSETQTLEEAPQVEYVTQENTGLIVETEQLKIQVASKEDMIGQLAMAKLSIENRLQNTSQMSIWERLNHIKNVAYGTATVLDQNN